MFPTPNKMFPTAPNRDIFSTAPENVQAVCVMNSSLRESNWCLSSRDWGHAEDLVKYRAISVTSYHDGHAMVSTKRVSNVINEFLKIINKSEHRFHWYPWKEKMRNETYINQNWFVFSRTKLWEGKKTAKRSCNFWDSTSNDQPIKDESQYTCSTIYYSYYGWNTKKYFLKQLEEVGSSCSLLLTDLNPS